MKLKISKAQFFCLIPNILYAKAIGITSGVFVRKMGSDSWISMLFGYFIGILIVIIMTYLCSKFPDKTIIQISEDLLGKFTGKFVGLMLTAFFIVAFATSANVMTMHLKLYFLYQTPFILICVIYTILCMYGVYLGFEVFVRFSIIGFIAIVLLNATMFVGTIRDFQIINFLPLLNKGVVANMTNSIYSFGDISMVILAIGIVYPTLNIKKRTISLSFWAMMVGTFLVAFWMIMETGVMGSDVMQKYVVVCMEQVRSAEFTKYLPRYELLMVCFFIFPTYVQSTLMFHCSKYCIKQITGTKKDMFIIVPLTIIMVFVTYYMANDCNNYINFLTFPWSLICTIIGIGLPITLLSVKIGKDIVKRITPVP